jgi:hypothetical protein
MRPGKKKMPQIFRRKKPESKCGKKNKKVRTGYNHLKNIKARIREAFTKCYKKESPPCGRVSFSCVPNNKTFKL